MVDYIRIYGVSDGSYYCRISRDGKDKAVFNKDKEYIVSIINKYEIEPSTIGKNFIQYQLNDFKDIDIRELVKIDNITRKKCEPVHRKKSNLLRNCIIAGTGALIIDAAVMAGAMMNKHDVQVIHLDTIEKQKASLEAMYEKYGNQNIEVLEDEVVVTLDQETDKLNENADSPVLDTKDQIVVNLSQDSEKSNEFISFSNDENEKIFSFEAFDRNNGTQINNSRVYEDIYKKYGKKYGVDYRLMEAVGAIEHNGIHAERVEGKNAIGIQQVQSSTWVGHDLTAYNFETDSYETINVDLDSLSNVDYNIRVSTMIMQQNLRDFNYNVPLATQSYNMGCGNMDKVLTACAEDNNCTKKDIIDNPYNNIWTNYTYASDAGNKVYARMVLSCIDDGSELVFVRPDHDIVSIIVDNTNVDSYTR